MTDEQHPPQSADAEVAAPPATARRSGALGLRIARALLAPVLTLGAVGVHFWVNVPEEKVVVNKRDQGSKKKKRVGPARKAIKPRSSEQMDAAWERWSKEPYEGEPIKGKWGRRQQSIVNKAVVVARKEAFDGAPEEPRVVVSGTQCRTIRCRFLLRSPFEHELALTVKTMRQLQADGEPLWRSLETKPVDPPTPQSPRDDHYLEVTIGVNVDGVEASAIEVGPADQAIGEAPVEDEPGGREGEGAKPEDGSAHPSEGAAEPPNEAVGSADEPGATPSSNKAAQPTD